MAERGTSSSLSLLDAESNAERLRGGAAGPLGTEAAFLGERLRLRFLCLLLLLFFAFFSRFFFLSLRLLLCFLRRRLSSLLLLLLLLPLLLSLSDDESADDDGLRLRRDRLCLLSFLCAL
jgi:hypothetical protein